MWRILDVSRPILHSQHILSWNNNLVIKILGPAIYYQIHYSRECSHTLRFGYISVTLHLAVFIILIWQGGCSYPSRSGSKKCARSLLWWILLILCIATTKETSSNFFTSFKFCYLILLTSISSYMFMNLFVYVVKWLEKTFQP